MRFKKKRFSDSPLRHQYWNYGWNGAYFVTICTKDRAHFFGKIVKGKMQLSLIGEIAFRNWSSIPDHFPFVRLGEFIIMPDHIHGVIIIEKTNISGSQDLVNHQKNQPDFQNNFGPQSRNLGSIIRGFKVGTTIHSRKINPDFAWQSRFHDVIIRNRKSFNRISNYIINNPKNW